MKNSLLIDLTIQHKIIQNKFGKLAVIEDKLLGHSFKRIYYIYDVKKGNIRGFHAHKNLKQWLVCLRGKILVNLDNGKKMRTIILNNPSKILIVDKLIWHTMEWKTTNAILMVIADDYYKENDYIRNYSKFKEIIGEI
jgi:dTDP-4-dehydrorhamnose 3,5-epimerase-like enzyme